MTPRRDVVAVWERTREAVERMQRSIHPHRDLFTSVPPKWAAASRVLQRYIHRMRYGLRSARIAIDFCLCLRTSLYFGELCESKTRNCKPLIGQRPIGTGKDRESRPDSRGFKIIVILFVNLQ